MSSSLTDRDTSASAGRQQPPGANTGPAAPKLRRFVYLGVAGFFFALGAAGAILPGLPATPFLLLTSYFLVRSSPRLNERLLKTRLFGPLLRDWQQKGGVRPGIKWKALAVIFVVVGLMLLLTQLSPAFKLSVGLLAIVGVVVVVRLPTVRDDDADPADASGESDES